MKYARLLLIPLMVSFFNAPSDLFLAQLRQQEIDKNAVAISAKIKRDYYIRMALIGMVAVRIGYLGWDRYLKGYFYPIAVNQDNLIPQELLNKTSIAQNIPKLTWGEWAQQKFNKEHIGAVVKKNSIAVGKFVGLTAMQSGIGFVMQGVYSRVNYPDTLRWYVCTQASYVKVIENISDTLLVLQDASLSADRILHDKQMMQDLYQLLVCDGEKIAGYMQYKSKQLSIERQMIAERAVRHFVIFYNDALKNIHTLHAQDDYVALSKEIDVFAKELKRYLRHFAVVEGETDEQRYVVGEMSQQLAIIGIIASLF